VWVKKKKIRGTREKKWTSAGGRNIQAVSGGTNTVPAVICRFARKFVSSSQNITACWAMFRAYNPSELWGTSGEKLPNITEIGCGGFTWSKDYYGGNHRSERKTGGGKGVIESAKKQ